MRNRKQLSEDELRRALREDVKYDTEFFLKHDLKPEHHFSEQFIEKMNPLLQAARQGTVKAAEYFMGWQYYAKQGIAAVLICFLLACVAMPEAVLAGYHKLIEVVETIYEEYTEFRYKLDYDKDSVYDEKFRPIELTYLPEGMEKIKWSETEKSVSMLYMNSQEQYFKLNQKMITEDKHIIYDLDTQNAWNETVEIKNEIVEFVVKEGRTNFVWIHENNRIIGQSNLSKEEIIKILESLK